jgi:hypothetical protein|tara:strand:- start:33 stop:851 length:819 start_codon:yes stop_codon:yes gene_type:complete
MKKYHGSRRQFSYVEKEQYASPLEAIDRVSDDDFIDVLNEIVSDSWLKKYNTTWLKKLRTQINNQRTGFISEVNKKGLVRSMLAWCEGQDITFGVGLNEGKYFRDIANDVTNSLLQFPFGHIEKYEDILNEHSHKFRRRGDGIHGFHKNSTPFLEESKQLIIMAYKHFLPKIEESIEFVEYDNNRVIRAERMGFTNTASHAQLTRIFQDAIVAFSNEKTLDEIIERASDGKQRIAKMMRRDLGITKINFAEEKKQYHYEKNLTLFNRLLDVL